MLRCRLTFIDVENSASELMQIHISGSKKVQDIIFLCMRSLYILRVTFKIQNKAIHLSVSCPASDETFETFHSSHL
jgi:hypothetical protein